MGKLYLLFGGSCRFRLRSCHCAVGISQSLDTVIKKALHASGSDSWVHVCDFLITHAVQIFRRQYLSVFGLVSDSSKLPRQISSYFRFLDRRQHRIALAPIIIAQTAQIQTLPEVLHG